MPTLFETIQRWADGQNGLNAREFAQRQALHAAVGHMVISLRRYDCLVDLAAIYHAEDDPIRRIGEEFDVSLEELTLLRNAAFWQRFMEIRHPQPTPKRRV